MNDLNGQVRPVSREPGPVRPTLRPKPEPRVNPLQTPTVEPGPEPRVNPPMPPKGGAREEPKGGPKQPRS